MDIFAILGIALVVIVIIVSLKLFRSVFKTIISVVGLLLVCGIIFGVLVAKDMQDFKEDFLTNDSTYLLEDNGSIVAGFKSVGFDFSTFQPVSVDNKSYPPENISSDDPIHFYIDKDILVMVESDSSEFAVGSQELLDSKDENMRSRGFMVSLSSTLVQNGPLYLFKQIKNETVTIKPSRFIFEVMSFTPKKLWSGVEGSFVDRKNQLKNISLSKNNESET
ncbi:MAG: hypothetical protein ACQESC_01425 [Nanobdellota archaeon]